MIDAPLVSPESVGELLAFQGCWRDYQQSILDSLDSYLGDDRLHIVAAPGSGKTVLGLEVMRRIGRPTIVLAPTVAIRNQWIDRLCGMFRPAPHLQPDWVSTSIAEPRLLTVITYQALHAAMAEASADDAVDEVEGEDAADDVPDAVDETPGRIATLLAFFNGLGPATIVLDEAHHLRREWWRALTDLHTALPGVRLVSLTATPPYDVDYAEWQRYETLCGPIDDEISVPALVRNGDLCPHQDHVHVSLPVADEDALVSAHRDGLFGFVTALRSDADLLAIVLAHPWFADPAAYEEEILAAPELYSAMMIFARFAGVEPPRAALKLLGVRASAMPDMSAGWLEILLDAMLFSRSESFEHGAAWLKAARTELRRLGAVEGKRVRLLESRAFYSTLAGSLAKIGSVIEIARAEAGLLGDDLRMVVLTDHVRVADMPRRGDDPFRPTRLGVVPIFEALRRSRIAGVRLGVLTGSLVIIPANAVPALEAAARALGIVAGHLRIVPLDHDPSLARIDVTGESAHRIVQLVTRLFDAGEVNLLVGTQALLGEGWDAPTVNTLVLASHVGSYMLSNQMRGRAIRTDPARPAKAANIWHLATVTPDTLADALSRRLGWSAECGPSDPIGRLLGPDMEMLKRRFLAFEGVGQGADVRIQNGISRLELAGREWDAEGVGALNAAMLARAGERGLLDARWRTALGGAVERQKMRQIASVNHTPRMMPFADTLRYLAITGVLGGLLSGANAMRGQAIPSGVGAILLLFLGLAFLYSLPKLGRAIYLLARNGTLERSIAQVGYAIIDGLDHAGLITSEREWIHVEVRRSPLGKCLIHVENAQRSEERLILGAIEEVLGPVRNPRYLIVRESLLGRWLRIDYHAVPSAIGQTKANAEYFAERWSQLVGQGKLVYLRTAKGRRILLRARARSLAAGFQRFVDRMSAWQ